MALFSTGFEVSPAGTAIPTTGAGNGGTSFNVGANGTGATVTSDSATAASIAEGSFVGKFAVGNTAGITDRGWTVAGGVTYYFRMYIYLTAQPNSNLDLVRFVGSTTNRARLRITTGGALVFLNGTTTVTTTTGTIPLNTLVRIECSHFSGTSSNGTFTAEAYSGHSTTPITNTTISSTGQTFAGAVDTVRAGISISGPTNFTLLTDGWQLQDTGAVGPISTTTTVTPNSITSGAVVPSPTVAATLTATPNSVTTGEVVPSPTVTVTPLLPPVVATASGVVNASTSGYLTVPAGVTTSHLGVILSATANPAATGFNPVIPGWTVQARNPTEANNSEVTVFTRLGGHTAGDVLTFSASTGNATQAYWYAVWYDTSGKDVVVAGTPGGRSGVSAATTSIPSVTTTVDNQAVIVVATERSATAGTVISSWAPSAPTQALFVEDANTATSGYIGAFVQSTAGATGGYTPTYSTASGNGVGLLLVTGAPVTSTTVSPTSVPTGEVVPAPSVAATLTATPGSITTGAVVPSPSVAAVLTATPTSITTGAVVPSPAVSSSVLATPTSITSGAVVPSPTVTPVVSVSPGSITSGAVVPAPAVAFTGGSSPQTVAPVSIVSGEVVGLPALLAGAVSAIPDAIPSQAVVPEPSITAKRLVKVFYPPSSRRITAILGNLRVATYVGHWLLYLDGQWIETEVPTNAALSAASLAFQGGYRHEVDDATAAVLTAGGYTITTEFV